MENQPIVIEATLTADEYVRANRVIQNNSPINLVSGFLMAAAGVFGLVDLFMEDPNVLFDGYLIAGCIGFFLLIPRLWNSRTRKAYLNSKVMQGPLKWTFDDTGILIETTQSHEKKTWDEILSVRKHREFYFLYIRLGALSAAHFIPIKWLQSTEQEARFITLLQAHNVKGA